MHAIHSALNMASFKLVYLVCFISISLWLCSSAHRVLADNEEQGPIKPDNFFGFGPIWGKGKDGIFGGGGGGGGGSSSYGTGSGSGYGSGSGGSSSYGMGSGSGYGSGSGSGYGGGWVPAGLCEFCNKGGFVYGFQGGPSSCYVMSGGPHPTPTHPPAGQTEPINEMKSDPKSTLTVNPTPNSPPAGNTEPINNIKEKIKPDHDGGKPKPRSSQSVHPTSDHPSPFTPPISQSLTPPTAPDLHPILGN
ncbi:hypothetical protein AQUCO_02300196v1 [Aquilegia coerulea]|uniref:Glycine-rich protein n=1 Tax=Aquilegia coerulea TaxID=218851 RepID=A0A2G5DCH5_AQUCA|nr:hypothetical protein AQUCO_02300196v1 [Aquilegia coerulea]